MRAEMRMRVRMRVRMRGAGDNSGPADYYVLLLLLNTERAKARNEVVGACQEREV